jgi:hypothetical protein
MRWHDDFFRLRVDSIGFRRIIVSMPDPGQRTAIRPRSSACRQPEFAMGSCRVPALLRVQRQNETAARRASSSC